MEPKTIEIGKAKYIFTPEDSFTNDQGNKYEYVSIKKVTTFKEKSKFQTITIKHEDFPAFRDWLLECLTDGEDSVAQEGYEGPPAQDDVPF